MAETEDSRAKQRARHRKWMAANREWSKQYKQEWAAANRERLNAQRRAWNLANPEKARLRSSKTKAAQKANNPERYAYQGQKDSAKRRGIPFLLTFEEWWTIWEASGKWKERGLGSDQYCMARNGDVGAYEAGNVRIITGRENRIECRKGKSLTEAHRRALVEAWKKRGPISDAHRAAMVKAWEKRRHRLPALRISRRVLPNAHG